MCYSFNRKFIFPPILKTVCVSSRSFSSDAVSHPGVVREGGSVGQEGSAVLGSRY